ncbi:MAG: hypothetical protein HC896_14900 [Bacteroidales bacterium]|nr:hypothetical protein [Bacteroidales bacterium]
MVNFTFIQIYPIMFTEGDSIEKIQLRISEYQKQIKLRYARLHSEDIDSEESTGLIQTIDDLNGKVLRLQNLLREQYKEHFKNGHQQTQETGMPLR